MPWPLSNAQGVATGTALVNGGSQTGRSVITDGWSAEGACPAHRLPHFLSWGFGIDPILVPEYPASTCCS